NKGSKEIIEIRELDIENKRALFEELNLKGNLSKDTILSLLGFKPIDWELNFSSIEGNRTNKAFYDVFLKIIEMEGYDVKELLKVKNEKDEVDLSKLSVSAAEIKQLVHSIFGVLNINTAILEFNAELEGKSFELQESYQLWHLLYSYEGDNSASGNEKLYKLLNKKFGFSEQYAKLLANITLSDDYGSLSAKAMRKIFPFIKENIYSTACNLAGYNHSSSLTKDENDNRVLKEHLELLPKNSLRNPIVEKILNQMVNVVNAIINDPSLGKPDEIRIELARELKKNAKERQEMSAQINKSTTEHEIIRQLLIKEDGIKNPTRRDIIRYKLYQELKINGYKTLYSCTYIPRERLFSKEFDIEHIIPKSKLFDDSFSNKTLCVRKENQDKGDETAYDFISGTYGADKLQEYIDRVEMMYSAKEGGISKGKYKKLLMKGNDIGSGFIERDLRDTQYIAKKAKQMLFDICRTVVSTSGSITDRLREDWDLVNIMQELNIEKYRKQGLTEMIEKKDGGKKERIVDWTKRNDHRHHAMDALTIAFTKPSHIQYLNNLNARKKEDKYGREVIGIEQKETYMAIDELGNKKRKFKLPIPNFRVDAKNHLENVLVSFKAKNKVATKNKNKYVTKTGEHTKIELTPRGQLHNQTVYGMLYQYTTKEEKIGARFDEVLIQRVASEKYKIALHKRLMENNNDPKKAFTGNNSPDKNPIYTDDAKASKVPEKVKLVWIEPDFTIRKDINPDNFNDAKSLTKVIDVGVKNILLQRLSQYNGNAKEAFSNLELNPIWLNKEKGITIKRVTISGVKNAEALHYKKDHLGKPILSKTGNNIPVDFVSTSNNHHVAIYRDNNGDLQEKVVSFYEVVHKINQQLPIVDKTYNQGLGWKFLFTIKQNEYFIFPSEGFDPAEIDLLNPDNYKIISHNLFRVQKIATKNYFFRHHLETMLNDAKELKDVAYKNIRSLPHIEEIVKVRINHIGQIVKVGEY
ncbi:MAG: type II CRISPR RNA-guided endonuclease Cas9, partial [Bacteroidota bacterium]